MTSSTELYWHVLSQNFAEQHIDVILGTILEREVQCQGCPFWCQNETNSKGGRLKRLASWLFQGETLVKLTEIFMGQFWPKTYYFHRDSLLGPPVLRSLLYAKD